MASSSALLMDTTSLYAYHQTLDSDRNIDYKVLHDVICEELEVEFSLKIAFVAVNPDNDNQRKFLSFLRDALGFVVDEADYREAYVVPNKEHPYQRLTSRLAYTMGGLLKKSPDLAVISDAFDLRFVMNDYVQRGGHLTFCTFKSSLEYRWQRALQFEEDYDFFDLDQFTRQVMGADNPTQQGNVKRSNKDQGLSDIDF